MSDSATTEELNTVVPDEVLDAYGLLCPMPIVKTVALIKTMSEGQVLEIIATDEGIKEDMPAWCRATGNEYLGVTETGGEYHVFLRKGRLNKRD